MIVFGCVRLRASDSHELRWLYVERRLRVGWKGVTLAEDDQHRMSRHLRDIIDHESTGRTTVVASGDRAEAFLGEGQTI